MARALTWQRTAQRRCRAANWAGFAGIAALLGREHELHAHQVANPRRMLGHSGNRPCELSPMPRRKPQTPRALTNTFQPRHHGCQLTNHSVVIVCTSCVLVASQSHLSVGVQLIVMARARMA